MEGAAREVWSPHPGVSKEQLGGNWAQAGLHDPRGLFQPQQSWHSVLFSCCALLQVENVKLLDRYASRRAASGTLYLTATHLIYVDASAEGRKETWVWAANTPGKAANTPGKAASGHRMDWWGDN